MISLFDESCHSAFSVDIQPKYCIHWCSQEDRWRGGGEKLWFLVLLNLDAGFASHHQATTSCGWSLYKTVGILLAKLSITTFRYYISNALILLWKLPHSENIVLLIVVEPHPLGTRGGLNELQNKVLCMLSETGLCSETQKELRTQHHILHNGFKAWSVILSVPSTTWAT